MLKCYVSAFMNDQDDLPLEYSDLPRERLKHGTGRFRDIVLVPQPSDSPNDPLNVSAVRHGHLPCGHSLTMSASRSGPNGTKSCPQAH